MVFNTNTVNVAGKKGKYLFVYFFALIKAFKLFCLKRHTVFSINIPLLTASDIVYKHCKRGKKGKYLFVLNFLCSK